MTASMGIGKLGDANLKFIRKWRWVATITSKDGKTTHLKPTFVKLGARPIHDSEKECSQSNDYVYECKYSNPQMCSVTVMDAQTAEMTPLYEWLAKVYDFTSDPVKTNKEIADSVLTLQMYDGVGVLMESFILKDCWITQINFGELDYSSSDSVDIELTFRYTELEFRDELGIANAKKN
jgi:hypothetical protein